MVEREVEVEHVDGRLAEDAKGAVVGVRLDQPEHGGKGEVSARGDPRSLSLAFVTVIAGSRPLPEAVTASTGTGTSGLRPFSLR